jgi:nucleoside phosphorylase
MPRQLAPEEYTVGWVCALPIELTAALAMLDEEHDNCDRDIDDTVYCMGSMAGHNVVIVCLPAGCIGNNPAAAVGAQMRAKFKGIRFGLMVGVGGGVPSVKNDIRLGDVVVSHPHQTFGGLVQYDTGKTTPSGFQRTGCLNSPPQILLSAVNVVRARWLQDGSTLSSHLDKLESNPDFHHSRTGPDILFEATYNCEDESTCTKCDVNRQQIRQPRKNEKEVVAHYGTIASGNQVMRTAAERDRVSAELGGVLCFEMEAAGIMNSFPCLVIRGICDYADSHKNKRWQAYAAGTAAAYAKKLLSSIPSAKVVKQSTMPNVVEGSADFTGLAQPELNVALDNLARKKGGGLRWQSSVIDLLKLLGQKSSREDRDKLAERLHVHVGQSGSAEQNDALREAVMRRLVAEEAGWREEMKNRAEDKFRCLNCGLEHRESNCTTSCGKCIITPPVHGSLDQLTADQALIQHTKHHNVNILFVVVYVSVPFVVSDITDITFHKARSQCICPKTADEWKRRTTRETC